MSGIGVVSSGRAAIYIEGRSHVKARAVSVVDVESRGGKECLLSQDWTGELPWDWSSKAAPTWACE